MCVCPGEFEGGLGADNISSLLGRGSVESL